MEVIFIKDLKGQGKKGDIKNVKDGYAENFLIKNNYAVRKTKESLNKLNHELKKRQELDLENKNKALEVCKRIENLTLEFKVQTGENDKVFGSISQKQIKEKLEALGEKIDKNKIKINTPIASLGFHNIEILLYNDVIAKLKIHVIK